MDTDVITVEMWHELSDTQKEVLRQWAVSEDIGLEIVQSETSETCDYAGLLTRSQLLAFLSSQGVETKNETMIALWDLCKKRLS